MAKVEIERGPLVGGVLIAVSAAIAVALNMYSRPTVPDVKEALPHVQHVETPCGSDAAADPKPTCTDPDDGEWSPHRAP